MCFIFPEGLFLKDVQTFQYFLQMDRLSFTPVSSKPSVPNCLVFSGQERQEISK